MPKPFHVSWVLGSNTQHNGHQGLEGRRGEACSRVSVSRAWQHGGTANIQLAQGVACGGQFCTSCYSTVHAAQAQYPGRQLGQEAAHPPERSPLRDMWDCCPAPTPSRKAIVLRSRWLAVLAAVTMLDCILLTALWRCTVGGRAAVLSARNGVRIALQAHLLREMQDEQRSRRGELFQTTEESSCTPAQAVTVSSQLRAVSPGSSSHAAGDSVAAPVTAGCCEAWCPY